MRDREEQAFSEEDESRINENVEDLYGAGAESGQTHVQAIQRVPPQLFQRPRVCWEWFLPVTSIKVLLAENDDSTRRVVSALLQNCGYEVMSPHGSMSIVFKCLSKGAADYLVKPIRKNELNNLWQHVWRKCHRSRGSGSESGTQTRKPTKSRSDEESDINARSNIKDEVGAPSLNMDGSDNGSTTQSSWTKRGEEVDSPGPMSCWDQPPHQTDSNYARIIHSRPETFGSNWVPTTAANKCDEQHDLLANPVVGLVQLEEPSRKRQINSTGVNNDKLARRTCEKSNEPPEKEKPEPVGDLANPVPMGFIPDSSNPMEKGQTTNTPSGLSKVSATNDARKIPFLELTLWRPQDANGTEAVAQDWNVFRHSDFSAFSRYNFISTANQAPIGNAGSCSPVDNSTNTKSMQNHRSISNNTTINEGSIESSNNDDMGSATNYPLINPAALGDKPTSESAFRCFQPSSAFHQVQPRCINQQIKEMHHHQFYDGTSLKEMMLGAPQCGSSNVPGGAQGESNGGNHSLNGSGSVSNHGSNAQTGCSIGLNPEEKNIEGDNGVGRRGGAANSETGLMMPLELDQVAFHTEKLH